MFPQKASKLHTINFKIAISFLLCKITLMTTKKNLLSDENGKPMVLYHGTYYNFDYFRPLTHFGNKFNAERNLKEGKWKRDPNIDINKPKIIPVNISNYRYPEIPDLNDHSVANWKGILFQYMSDQQIKDFLNAMEISDEGEFQQRYKVEFDKLMNSKITVPPEFDFVCEPVSSSMTGNDINEELAAETLFDIYNNENLFFQRMILYFESIGIHGFKYKNFTEGSGNCSYIMFRQNDIHRLDKKLPPYKVPKLSGIRKLIKIKNDFLSTHRPRVLSKKEKQSLLNEIYNFYVFRFNEITRKRISAKYLETPNTK